MREVLSLHFNRVSGPNLVKWPSRGFLIVFDIFSKPMIVEKVTDSKRSDMDDLATLDGDWLVVATIA